MDTKRQSGILLHITSLPNSYGIGTLGKSAYAFADWLHKAGQSLWQILPLGPTGYGDSPYASFSTFAGNPLLIDLDALVEKGWAKKEDILPPSYIKATGSVDYGSVVWWKMPVLYTCAAYFLEHCTKADRVAYEAFKNDQSAWLDNFAAYTSIKKHYDAEAQKEGITGVKSMWNQYWPKNLAAHDMKAVSDWIASHTKDIEEIKVVQFFFNEQWQALKRYVNERGIKIIGDIPIFVAGDSADVWANRTLFQMDENTLLQKTCAGVPPDYFSATGQLWGNPLYDWDAMKKDGYSWWVARIQNMLRLVDIVRIDHFRGFEAYWQIPYGAENAIKGTWVKAPGNELFTEIKRRMGTLPIIAEDLGVITPEVEKLRDDCGFPGMKILQFAFNGEEWSEESAASKDLPSNYTTENIVVYTGTHDNDTTAGFFESAPEMLKRNVVDYLKLKGALPQVIKQKPKVQELNATQKVVEQKKAPVPKVTQTAKELTEALVKAAFLSKARYCVIPLQDVYALKTESRMNTPSTTGSNWAWRMEANLIDESSAQKLLSLTKESGRIS